MAPARSDLAPPAGRVHWPRRGQRLAGVWARTGAQDISEAGQSQQRGGAERPPCLPSTVLEGCGLFCPLLPADVSDLRRLLSAFHKPHEGLIQAARQLLSDEQAPLRQKLLADLLHTVSGNIAAETRAEDPPWFEGSWGSGGGWAQSPAQGGLDPHCSSRAGLAGLPCSHNPGAGLSVSELWGRVRDMKFSVSARVSV